MEDSSREGLNLSEQHDYRSGSLSKIIKQFSQTLSDVIRERHLQ